MTEHELGQDTEHPIQNINCYDSLEIYKLFVIDNTTRLMVQQSNKYAMQYGIGKKGKKIKDNIGISPLG